MKDEIQKIFKGEVDDTPDTLTKYSRDASLLLVRPQVVVFPKDSEDVQNLVRWVNDNKAKYPHLSITARCAGTDMSGGAIGESIIMDFTRHMNRLIGWNHPLKNSSEATSITVEPGMFYRDFEKITLERGMILPCYTASKSLNAMGGMFGNNAAGEKTLKYGKTEDYILETKIVFADGVERVVKPISLDDISQKEEMYKKLYTLIKQNKEEIKKAKPKVHKNSAGYYLWNVIQEDTFDLNKLLVGSQGTLGIATEITFKLIRNPEYSKLVAIFINDLEPLGRLVYEILQLRPETLEAYDDKTMKLAIRFFPDFLKNKGLVGMIKFLWSFLPEAFMMAYARGFPKLILLVEFAGVDNADTDKKCTELVKKIESFKLKTHITESQAESGKYWDIRRESFSLLRKHVNKKHTAPFIDDIIVRPEFLPKFIPELNKILSKYDLTFTIAGHAGDGNFHVIPLMDFSLDDTSRIIMELSEAVYDLVERFHGSITAEHNDGLIRTPFLPKMYNKETILLFREVKKIFDPEGIFNPGKKVALENGAGTKEYIALHIAREHSASHKV
ncbi:MAG: FAD-binding oxidoreductase [bacterium]|nr:FAD-binding oxidoreductase [bacterium]